MFRQWISLFGLILFANAFQFCTAQSKDTSFRLLWYKGKKISDTVILIPNGQTITYKPSKGKVEVSTPVKQDILNTLTKEIKRADQRKAELNKLVVTADKGALNAALVYQINNVMDEIEANYRKLRENSIDLGVEKSGLPKTFEKNLPPQILQAYEDVVDFIKESNDISSSPSPPSTGFDYCYPCDMERKAVFKRDSIEFMNWLDPEKNNLAKAIKVLGYFGLRKSQNILYDTAIEAEMFGALTIIMGRLENKLLQSWKQFKNDETKLPFLAQQMVEFIRAQQLIGIKSRPEFPAAIEIAATTVDAGMNHLSKAKAERDFKVLLNIRWIVSLFRTAELLGMDPEKFNQRIMDFARINQFKVYTDARGKMSNDGTVLAARITGENIFAAVPDSNCILKWTLISPDPSKMKFNLEEILMKTPDVTPVYTGTKSWKSYPANLQLDFCNDEKDTVFLHGFSPSDGTESWTAQGKTIPQTGIIHSIYSSCFMDIKRMEAMAADPNLQARMEEQLKASYQKFMAGYQGGKDPSKMTPAEIQKMNEAMLASRDMMNTVQSMSVTALFVKKN